MTTRQTNKEDKTEAPAFVPSIGKEFDELLADADREVVAYVPPKHPAPARIAGRVVATEQVSSAYGRCPASVLDTDPNDPTAPLVRFAWMGTVLESAYGTHLPQRGDTIAAVRLGVVDTGRAKRDGGEGNEVYDNWRVIVRPGGSV